jgi:hypothetical protein
MNDQSKQNFGNGSYEEIEKQIARDLGLSCSMAHLRRVLASAGKLKQRGASEERTELDQMLAGKTGAERLRLVRVNKERIRNFLGLTPKASGQMSAGGRITHRRFK